MFRKYLPVISAVILAGLIFAVFVVIDSNKSNKAQIKTPIAPDGEFLLGVTTASTVNSDLDAKDIPNFSKKEINDLKTLMDSKTGKYGLYIKDLSSGETYTYNENKNMYGASLYKIPVAIAVFKEIEKGNISLDQVIEFKEEDSSPGAGSIQNSEFGKNYTIEELLNLLLKESDNVAQNMLIRIIGRDAVARTFPQAVTDNVFPLKINANALLVGKMLEDLYFNRYISVVNSSLMQEIMSTTSFDDRINNGLTPDLAFSHKIGNWATRGVWHDCGLVTGNKVIVVCLMSEDAIYEQFLTVAKEVGIVISSMNIEK